jgi:hypothetical protein
VIDFKVPVSIPMKPAVDGTDILPLFFTEDIVFCFFYISYRTSVRASARFPENEDACACTDEINVTLNSVDT